MINGQTGIRSRSAIMVAVVLLAGIPATLFADTRLEVGDLPEPLVSAENCIVSGSYGWGWDGQQSCRHSGYRFEGASLPLVETTGDYVGNSLSWVRSDLANKTVRCDSYHRVRLSSDNSQYGYTRDRYDITFMTQDTIPASAASENLSEVTAHLYTRGWSIRTFGRLVSKSRIDSALVDFNRDGFATETGYIFIEDAKRSSGSNENIVTQFSHCFLRDEDAPLRATGYCVDYDGDGIGWNGSKACDVVPTDPDCDYSKADLGANMGWGHNPVTGESCPPIGNPTPYVPSNVCRRTGFEGWGWNEALQDSCRL